MRKKVIAIGAEECEQRLTHQPQMDTCGSWPAARVVNAIHPLAKCEKGVTLGENVFHRAYTYVNVRATIGDGVLVITAASLNMITRSAPAAILHRESSREGV